MKWNFLRTNLLRLMLFLILPSLTACTWQQNLELSRHREKWQEQNITNYRYKISIISDWGANEWMPLTVVAKNGETISVIDKNGNDRPLELSTITSFDAMFQEIDDSLSARHREVETEYDQVYGFPVHMHIFYNDRGVGGETSRDYTVGDFEILP